jgi:hypothetical protein
MAIDERDLPDKKLIAFVTLTNRNAKAGKKPTCTDRNDGAC